MIGSRYKLLALVTDAFGGAGGIAQYNRDFIQALAADDQIVDITVAPRLSARPYTETPPRTRQLKAIKDQVLYSMNALMVALRTRPDLVFCGHLFMAPLAILAGRLTGARVILQTHGIEVWARPGRLQTAAIEACDLVLCVSRDTRERLLTWTRTAPDRVLVTPNTVADRFTPGDGGTVRAALGLSGKTILLSVSRLDPTQQYKGQDRVIGVLAALRARGHDAIFLVGGSGEDSDRLKALAQSQGVADHVRFLGEVSNEQLLDLYRAADLYLMPSSGEGFGIVFLEAMACGAPAIGLALGGATDALGRGLGEAVAAEDLLEAIERALTAPRPDPVALSAEVRRRYGRTAFQGRASGLIARLAESAPAANARGAAA